MRIGIKLISEEKMVEEDILERDEKGNSRIKYNSNSQGKQIEQIERGLAIELMDEGSSITRE